METNTNITLLTQVLPVLRLQSNLQKLALVDDTIVLTNKSGIHKHTITKLQQELVEYFIFIYKFALKLGNLS